MPNTQRDIDTVRRPNDRRYEIYQSLLHSDVSKHSNWCKDLSHIADLMRKIWYAQNSGYSHATLMILGSKWIEWNVDMNPYFICKLSSSVSCATNFRKSGPAWAILAGSKIDFERRTDNTHTVGLKITSLILGHCHDVCQWIGCKQTMLASIQFSRWEQCNAACEPQQMRNEIDVESMRWESAPIVCWQSSQNQTLTNSIFHAFFADFVGHGRRRKSPCPKT